MKYGYLFILSSIMLLSCEIDREESYTVTFNFYDDANGWIGDFSDYPVNGEEFYALEQGWTNLPVPLDTLKGAFRISGNNHSDDLFMYLKRKVDGLRPSTSYRITFEVELASNAPTNAAGIGGAPGESVILKVGAVQRQPDKVVVDGYYLMNLDKGNQSASGEDMVAIGHVGVSDTTSVYTLINRNNGSPFMVNTDVSGEFWVIVGTDSGFEGITTLYYSNIKLEIVKN